MLAIKEIVDSLISVSGRNAKIQLLEKHKDNKTWSELLRFLLDSKVVTGISNAKLGKSVPAPLVCVGGLVGLFDYLRINNTGRDVDVAVVQELMRDFPAYAGLIGQLATKSLRLGVDAATVNKVYGKGFIDVFKVMLAESYDSNESFVRGKDFIITQKLDGLRCVAFVRRDDTVQFFTRSGEDYGELPDVAAELLALDVRDVAYDGELIAKTDSTNVFDVFRETSSLARTDGAKRGLVYHIFDMLPLSEFLDGFSIARSEDRKTNFWFRLFESASRGNKFNWICGVKELYVGKDLSKIDEFAEQAAALGWEGVMLNIADAPYEAKRTKNLLKVKRFKTVDALVTGVYEGEGDFAGSLGGINVEFEHEGELFKSNCGTGFKKAERDKYWSNPALIVGEIVEIKYFEFSRNADGSRSLRLPVWINRFRSDKTGTSAH